MIIPKFSERQKCPQFTYIASHGRSRLCEQDFTIHSRERAPTKWSEGAAKTVVNLFKDQI
jgi:hypothetical protein